MGGIDYRIYPISTEECEQLGITEQEFKELGSDMAGMMLTPSRVREGVKRWVKHGAQDPLTDSDIVSIVYEDLTTKHKAECTLYERRLGWKDNALQKKTQLLQTEREKTWRYESVYGQIPTRPLNWLQRLIGRLFRIL